MTKRLRTAIESVIDNLDPDNPAIAELTEAYRKQREGITETMSRVEFLEECLEEGMNKREAARKLVEHDPRVSQRTAETIVYTAFSGQYQSIRRGRGSKSEERFPPPVPRLKAPPSVSSDEGDLL